MTAQSSSACGQNENCPRRSGYIITSSHVGLAGAVTGPGRREARVLTLQSSSDHEPQPCTPFLIRG